MSVNEKMTAIANAIRGKTGGTEPLTLDEMAVAISGIETGGGGGSMESGELTTTSANYYSFTIPVSSKKMNLLVLSKSPSDMYAQDTTTRCRALIAVDGVWRIQVAPPKQEETTVVGDSYWYMSENTKTVFSDDTINVTIAYSPWAIGDYLWFAW